MSPNEVEGWTGEFVTLSATARDEDGSKIRDVSVTWTSSDTSVATVEGDGQVRFGGRAGAAVIMAGVAGVSGVGDSADARSRGLMPDRVEVVPSSASLAPGEGVTFDATVRDTSGGERSMNVEWSSSDPSVVSVSEIGRATAHAEGEATITAEAGPAAGTATVTVASECSDSDPAWIWCDDFESDRLGAYFEHGTDEGEFVRMAGVGVDGSTAMRARFQEGEVEAGNLHLAFGRTPGSYIDPVDSGTEDYREIYWRIYVKSEAGWSGGAPSKLSRSMILASTGWAQAMIAHVWAGSGDTGRHYLRIDPASGTDEAGNLQSTEYNDFDALRWLGGRTGDTPLFDDAHVGQWYCVEAHVRLNDPGLSNGVFEMWINGEKDAERTGLNWVGDYQEYGINAVFLENYWNDGSVQEQERYMDDFVVSTERIGC